MSRSKKDASTRPAPRAFFAAFTLVSGEKILDCVTAYYNDTSIEISAAEDRPTATARFFGRLDYTRFNGLERLAVVLLLEGRGWFDAFLKTPRVQSQELSVQMIAAELRQHRSEFCAAVKWLCTEKPETRTGFGKLGRYPYSDRTSEKFAKYFEEHGLQHVKLHVMLLDGQRLFFYASCTHWVDLFCTFLLRECSGRFPHQMPIKLCRHCGKLFASTRSDTEFCPGGGCQRKNYWSEERHNDYEFVRRHMKFAENCVRPQSGYSLEDLRTKLEKPKVKRRLQAIQRRWPDWPKILKMIKTIGETAQVSKGSHYEATRRV